MARRMEGGPSAGDSSRPHGGMSGELGQTGGVLHALGVVASPDRALLLTGSYLISQLPLRASSP